MNCPNCVGPLQVTDRSGVEIDFCPQCRGVWLDRGELDKIIDRANPQREPASVGSADDRIRHEERTDPYRRYDRRPEDDRDDDSDDRPGYSRGGRPKRKGGFLEDLFDF